MSKPAKPKDDAAPRKTGRPSKYTPELAAEIARRLSDGEPLRQICRDEHMPHWTNIYKGYCEAFDLYLPSGETKTITVKATVAEHGVRDGVKQTIIKRPKAV